MDASLVELNQKIDTLSSQIAYLSEQAKIAERQRQERAELVHDITPLANQAFSLAVEQLEEIQENIDLNDLLRILKRLLRNGRNLEKILDQLESLADLVDTVSPLADDAFGKAVEVMSSLEVKGYFAFGRGGMKVMDRIVSSLTEQDLNHLVDAVTPAVSVVKQFTQPEVIRFANLALADMKVELAKPVDFSYLALLRLLRDPNTRRGFSFMLHALKVIGSQPSSERSRISESLPSANQTE